MTLYRLKQTVEAFQWKPPCVLPKWLHDTGFKQRMSPSRGWLGYIRDKRVRPGDFITNESPPAIYAMDEFKRKYERVK